MSTFRCRNIILFMMIHSQSQTLNLFGQNMIIHAVIILERSLLSLSGSPAGAVWGLLESAIVSGNHADILTMLQRRGPLSLVGSGAVLQDIETILPLAG